MFCKLSQLEIFELLHKRKVDVKNLVKLPKLEMFYTTYISRFDSIEIIPDIEIFGYEDALKENYYLETNYANISKTLWMIGRTGQGDEWFINKENYLIVFFDHNHGEYSIQKILSLNVSFSAFLQMAFLYKELEDLLDEKEISKDDITTFVKTVNSIHPNLYELYPFKYF